MGVALLDSLLAEVDVAGALPARRGALEALRRDGLPSVRDEAWKYTSLRALERRSPAAGDARATSRTIDPSAFALAAIDGPRLVFVNGALRADLCDFRSTAGLELLPLSTHPELLPMLLAEGAGQDRTDAFLRLNTALAGDGALIRTAPGARLEAPLHLVFAGAAAEAEIAWHLRLRCELGDDSRLRLVEHYLGVDGPARIGNLVTDFALGVGARLQVLHVQDCAESASLIRRSDFRLEERAELVTDSLELGGQLVRHDFRVHLAGREARFESRGVFALHGRQHADTHLDVWHDARDTVSEVTWRGAADQRARGVFHGAITIAPGADGSDARLSNKNLLLSAQAEIDTQPALEIYADEVKAVHGATVGQLDEQALFYLQARGIPLEAARSMLVGAFCSAALDRVEPVELRAQLETLLASRLPLALED